eukprot:9485464-Pyramimonas_sp.AAC.1
MSASSLSLAMSVSSSLCPRPSSGRSVASFTASSVSLPTPSASASSSASALGSRLLSHDLPVFSLLRRRGGRPCLPSLALGREVGGHLCGLMPNCTARSMTSGEGDPPRNAGFARQRLPSS